MSMRNDLDEYLETGMMGAYHPDKTFVRYDGDGVCTIFRDTDLQKRDGCFVRERQMLIDQQEFFITSVFPEHPTATPTDKMLELIDAELKKDTHAG